MSLPVGTDPVSEIMSTPGWRTSAAPTSPPPVTTLHTPGGRMSPSSAASLSELKGVSSLGLRTTVQPAASAGPSFQMAIMSG